jgi:hypothetical protein
MHLAAYIEDTVKILKKEVALDLIIKDLSITVLIVTSKQAGVQVNYLVAIQKVY